MLRCVPEAGAVGALLARGVGASVEMRRLLERERGVNEPAVVAVG
jgi:hypothetical protein